MCSFGKHTFVSYQEFNVGPELPDKKKAKRQKHGKPNLPFNKLRTINRDYGVFISSVVIFRILMSDSTSLFHNIAMRFNKNRSNVSPLMYNLIYFAKTLENHKPHAIEESLLDVIKAYKDNPILQPIFNTRYVFTLSAFMKVLMQDIPDPCYVLGSESFVLVSSVKLRCW